MTNDTSATTLRQQAEENTRTGNWDEAIAAWRALEDLHPEDPLPAEEAARLIVARARRACGLVGNDPKHQQDSHAHVHIDFLGMTRRNMVAQKLAHDVPFPHLPVAAQDLNRSALQQLEHAYRECPSDTEIALHLAKVYVENDREYPAEQLLEKHFKLDKSPRVQAAWEEVQMFRLELKVVAAREAVAEDPSPAAQEALAKFLAEQDRTETRIFRARSDREPHNAALQLELGRRLERGDKLIDASRYFAKAAADEALGPTAAWEAGRCCERLGEFPEAMHFYRQAANGARRTGHEIAGQSAMLAAAKLARQLKMHKLAQRYLDQLLTITPDHSEGLKLQREWKTPAMVAAATSNVATKTSPPSPPPTTPS